MNYVVAYLVIAWTFFALTDKERAPLFALLALSNAIQLCKGFMPIWLFSVLMIFIGGGICGTAYYYNSRKIGNTTCNILYILIGVLAYMMGIAAFFCFLQKIML